MTAIDVLRAIERALQDHTAAEVLDENSPLRDAMRSALAEPAVAVQTEPVAWRTSWAVKDRLCMAAQVPVSPSDFRNLNKPGNDVQRVVWLSDLQELLQHAGWLAHHKPAAPAEGEPEARIMSAARAYGNALATSAMDTKTLQAELLCVVRDALATKPAAPATATDAEVVRALNINLVDVTDADRARVAPATAEEVVSELDFDECFRKVGLISYAYGSPQHLAMLRGLCWEVLALRSGASAQHAEGEAHVPSEPPRWPVGRPTYPTSSSVP